MNKYKFLVIMMIVVLIYGFSGCMDSVNSAASTGGTCCILGIIGVILFIILIAYLLGGKKTVVQTQQSAQPQVVYPNYAPYRNVREESRAERRCPECGRVISEDSDICQYCGKRFRIFNQIPGSKILENVKDFKDGEIKNKESSIRKEEYTNEDKTPKIMYKTAHDLHYKIENIETAANIYQQIIEQYPDSDEAKYSKQQIENIKKLKTQQEKNTKKVDPIENKKSTYCFGCGNKLEGTPKFCPYCGTKIEEADQ